jgi:uncharacterized Zn-binding protein involved in type VI secretion
MGRARNTVPDVCKTPSPGGPVPIPYPVIMSMSSDLKGGTTTVKADGKMIAIKGSEFSRCSGDEAGTAGGVKSSTNMKEAKWLLYSFDVKIEGKNACRKTDKMTMNHANTVCLAGTDQDDVDPDDDKPSAAECNKAIKLLEQADRLAQKKGKKLPEKRKLALAAKIAAGTITSSDLPGSIQNEFPAKLKGKTLTEVRAICGKSK